MKNWELNTAYLKANEILVNISVTNDLAERKVKLMKEYSKILTNDEEQKQYLLQTVKKYRGALPDNQKSTRAIEINCSAKMIIF